MRGGYHPIETNMLMCKSCNHARYLHGPRQGKISRDEAARFLQACWKRRMARRYMRAVLAQMYQPVMILQRTFAD